MKPGIMAACGLHASPALILPPLCPISPPTQYLTPGIPLITPRSTFPPGGVFSTHTTTNPFQCAIGYTHSQSPDSNPAMNTGAPSLWEYLPSTPSPW